MEPCPICRAIAPSFRPATCTHTGALPGNGALPGDGALTSSPSAAAIAPQDSSLVPTTTAPEWPELSEADLALLRERPLTMQGARLAFLHKGNPVVERLVERNAKQLQKHNAEMVVLAGQTVHPNDVPKLFEGMLKKIVASGKPRRMALITEAVRFAAAARPLLGISTEEIRAKVLGACKHKHVSGVLAILDQYVPVPAEVQPSSVSVDEPQGLGTTPRDSSTEKPALVPAKHPRGGVKGSVVDVLIALILSAAYELRDGNVELCRKRLRKVNRELGAPLKLRRPPKKRKSKSIYGRRPKHPIEIPRHLNWTHVSKKEHERFHVQRGLSDSRCRFCAKAKQPVSS